MNKRYDQTYLAKGYSFSMNTKETGLNNNELIIGGTGTGKTMSIAESKIVNAQYQNYIIPVKKRDIVETYKPYLRNKKYKVYDLDLSNPSSSEIGINPLDYLHTEQDYIWFANCVVNIYEDNTKSDPYWNEAAISVLAAEITMLKWQKRRRPVTIEDLTSFHNSIQLMEMKGNTVTNVDILFKEIANKDPDSLAVKGWKQIIANPFKTASNIYTIVQTRLDKIFNKEIIRLSNKRKLFNIECLNKEKAILFIYTSPINITSQAYINLLYSLLFKELFNIANRNIDFRLNKEVHFICDDFAVGSKIPEFENYISIFRSAGISVTLFLQSEKQLANMYGDYAMNIIMNNCDTLCYTGGMDIYTQKDMATRTNKPFHEIIQLPLDEVIVCRRGEEPIFAKRYDILNDINWKEANHIVEIKESDIEF